ncbi:MAG: ATP-binding protein [Aggregatilineales bacterium]
MRKFVVMQIDTLTYLQTALAHMDAFIRQAVQYAQSSGQFPTDTLRGLVITNDEVTQNLQHAPFNGLWQGDAQRPDLFVIDDSAPGNDRLVHITRIFNLTTLDLNIFLLSLAPQLDRRYERLYAYLQDDIALKTPTVNLMMNLLGNNADERLAVWQRLSADMPLRKHALLRTITDNNAPQGSFIATQLYGDQRIVDYLFGGNTSDARISDTVSFVQPDATYDREYAADPAILNPPDVPIVFMEGKSGLGRKQAAYKLADAHRLPLLEINLARLNALELNIKQAWTLAWREAWLNGSALILSHWESILDENDHPPESLWDDLISYPYPVFICAATTWEPTTTSRQRRLLRWKFASPQYDERRTLWEQALTEHNVTLHKGELARIVTKFRFTPAQIKRAVLTAADLAVTQGRVIDADLLYAGAQAHSTLRLGRLARQVETRHTWDDLILPEDHITQLRELRTRAENVHLVQDIWGFGQKVAPRPGISALFAGESGTGKTMSAEVIARDLGLLMYKIDLSAVVSKYIGETEKNLSVIFEEAQASSAILFFDEADALFGKRSEVKDARDRYANIETAYLLQQIEDYDGVAILATNLRQNLDEAFTRRLDFVITYPFPDTDSRKRIWERHFPQEVPLAKDIDLFYIADRFPLSGGNIRNAALASAYLAAADGRVITTEHIFAAIRREHQKMGRLTMGEF